jgi:hypothetical protein
VLDELWDRLMAGRGKGLAAERDCKRLFELLLAQAREVVEPERAAALKLLERWGASPQDGGADDD